MKTIEAALIALIFIVICGFAWLDKRLSDQCDVLNARLTSTLAMLDTTIQVEVQIEKQIEELKRR